MPAVITESRFTPRIYRVPAGFSGYGVTGTSFVRQAALLGSVLFGYMDSSVGAISTSAPGASALLRTEQGSGDSMFIGLVDPAESGAETVSWINTVGSGVAMGFRIEGPSGQDFSNILEVTPISRVASMRNATWPAVTPTREGQVVVCLWGFNNDAAEPTSSTHLVTSSYDGASLVGAEHFSTTAGADSGTGYFVFNNPPVGVPFALQTNATPGIDSGTLATVLIDTYEVTKPFIVGGAAVLYNGDQTGNWPMPAKATIDALAEPGDVFFLANVPYLGRYTEFGNAAWLDGQVGGNASAPPTIGWVRLPNGADSYLDEWVSDPPTFAYNATSPTSYHVWGLIRGLVRTGNVYSASATGSETSRNYWSDVPFHGTADEAVLGIVSMNANGSFQWPTEPVHNQINGDKSGLVLVAAADWTPGAPGTGIDASWSFNRAPLSLNIALLEAKPTWRIASTVNAGATVTATLTSASSGQFLSSAIQAGVLVAAELLAFQPRRPAARREFLYLYGLDGTMIGVLS